jgi:AcrR family transcriptional regulator
VGGLIQHHFGSKDGLIAAVDGHALARFATTSVIEVGQRVNFLIAAV